MIENEISPSFREKVFEKTFNQYQIQIILLKDSINIFIHHINSYKIFQSNFNLKYLLLFPLFNTKSTIEEINELICDLVTKNKVKIEENKINIKLILISTFIKCSNVELILNEKNIISKEVIERLIYDINNLKIENKNIKKYFKNEIEQLNDKIKIIKNDKNEEINKLKTKLELINKENNIFKEEINQLNDKINLIEKEGKNKEINKIEKKMKKFDFYFKDIQLNLSNLKNINSLKMHDEQINLISFFPSGNIISVSDDKSIKIYNINFEIIQNIQNAHNGWITYVNVKDENNFITCSYDKSIKTWIKKDNMFQINQTIQNAHNDLISKVIYYSNGNIISCSNDKKIKIWEQDNNNIYQNIIILTHSHKIFSILLIEDKNILISGGGDGIKFWNINNYELLIHFKETHSGSWNDLCRIDDDKIIINGNDYKSLKVISISEKKIIKNINHSFYCYGVCLIEEKGLFLVCGESRDIEVYRNDNYECIQRIKNAHDEYILGICELKNGIIASYGLDQIIKIWNF